MKVLLVDDEKKFAVMLSRRLALRGIDVDFVHTGEAAEEEDHTGLAVADRLNQLGHNVVVYERDQFAGGSRWHSDT